LRFVSLEEGESARRLEASVNGLLDEHPHLSAAVAFTRAQRRSLVAAVALTVVLLVVEPSATSIVLVGSATFIYALVILNRLALFARSLRDDRVERVSDEEARAFPDELLPAYTVMVPAYHEPEVISLLLVAIGELDYPIDKLDVKVLLEADDDETIAAAKGVDLGPHIEAILVPPADPRTKPKALNFGLGSARGEIVTIFDAEDRPEPLQLRRAAVAFQRVPDDVVCLQAKLGYHNASQNLITKWFTLEYAMWFSLLLPGLVSFDAPIPLGGTSNHFLRRELEQLGAWDPFNVTEDADLGIRMSRSGKRTRVLESTTLEEANSDFVNWMKQRSRWYKGYLQTWLVHMRHPKELYDDLGARSFAQFNLFVGGTPFLAIINPAFWVMTLVWFLAHPHFIKAVFPAPVFYVALICWAVGNFAIDYITVITARVIEAPRLLVAAIFVPVYWVMMSVAAIKAALQLLFAPSYWEKTTHGLDTAGLARPAVVGGSSTP
jgi:cellulose synthase/poly-beta-1,6-N-acetylglucosamine synthase-like glycosyltransferase